MPTPLAGPRPGAVSGVRNIEKARALKLEMMRCPDLVRIIHELQESASAGLPEGLVGRPFRAGLGSEDTRSPLQRASRSAASARPIGLRDPAVRLAQAPVGKGR